MGHVTVVEIFKVSSLKFLVAVELSRVVMENHSVSPVEINNRQQFLVTGNGSFGFVQILAVPGVLAKVE